MLNQYKNYGLTKTTLADDAYLMIVGSLASVGNGCSRTIWALIYDKVGFKKVYFFANICQVKYFLHFLSFFIIFLKN